MCAQNRLVPADSVQSVHSHNLFLQLSDCCDTVTTGHWAEDTEQWSPASSQRGVSGHQGPGNNWELHRYRDSWHSVTETERERGPCHVSEAEYGCDLAWPRRSWQRPGEWPEAGAGRQATLVIVWFRGNTATGSSHKSSSNLISNTKSSLAGTGAGTVWAQDWTEQPL